jgi:large subunit ribosomal protein L10
MPTPQKEALVAEIRAKLEGAAGIILADYRGLSVKELQQLRRNLREAGAEVKVYKNSLAMIAVTEAGLPESLNDMLVGPSVFVFAGEDPVAPAKVMTTFAKEHAALEVKGGLVEGALVDAAGMAAVAALPSREELVAKMLGTMLNPMSGLVRVLNGPAGAFARVVQAIADQKAAA